jgi:2'-5' RNA ligase
MKPTSHFLGLSLKNEIFIELFYALEKYLDKNQLNEIVELQELSSLHITLYYFGKKIDKTNLGKIEEDLLYLNNKKEYSSVYIDQYNFFQKNGQIYLGYLCPSETQNLERINSVLKQRYISEVPDNNSPKFIPHISMFKIKDKNRYQKHNDAIITIIKEHLKVIKKLNAFSAFNLYSIDSNYCPEKQKVIL